MNKLHGQQANISNLCDNTEIQWTKLFIDACERAFMRANSDYLRWTRNLDLNKQVDYTYPACLLADEVSICSYITQELMNSPIAFTADNAEYRHYYFWREHNYLDTIESMRSKAKKMIKSEKENRADIVALRLGVDGQQYSDENGESHRNSLPTYIEAKRYNYITLKDFKLKFDEGKYTYKGKNQKQKVIDDVVKLATGPFAYNDIYKYILIWGVDQCKPDLKYQLGTIQQKANIKLFPITVQICLRAETYLPLGYDKKNYHQPDLIVWIALAEIINTKKSTDK